MTSKGRVPSLKPLKKATKPATALQAAWLASRQKDLNHTSVSTSALLHKLKTPEDPSTSAEASWSAAQGAGDQNTRANDDTDEDLHPQPFGLVEDAGAEASERGGCLDPQSTQAVIEQLNSAAYQAQRLEEQNRWNKQWERMLDAYLVCKHNTSDWGHPELWNSNFNSNCNCSSAKRQKRFRTLDLVDQFCKNLFQPASQIR